MNEKYVKDLYQLNELFISDLTKCFKDDEDERIENGKKFNKNMKTKKVLKSIKGFYKIPDEDLAKGKADSAIKQFLKFVVSTGAAVLVNPLLGIISYRVLKSKIYKDNIESREKVLKFLRDELEFVEYKLERCEEDDERKNLIKIRSQLKIDINKVKVI